MSHPHSAADGATRADATQSVAVPWSARLAAAGMDTRLATAADARATARLGGATGLELAGPCAACRERGSLCGPPAPSPLLPRTSSCAAGGTRFPRLGQTGRRGGPEAHPNGRRLLCCAARQRRRAVTLARPLSHRPPSAGCPTLSGSGKVARPAATCGGWDGGGSGGGLGWPGPGWGRTGRQSADFTAPPPPLHPPRKEPVTPAWRAVARRVAPNGAVSAAAAGRARTSPCSSAGADEDVGPVCLLPLAPRVLRGGGLPGPRRGPPRQRRVSAAVVGRGFTTWSCPDHLRVAPNGFNESAASNSLCPVISIFRPIGRDVLSFGTGRDFLSFGTDLPQWMPDFQKTWSFGDGRRARPPALRHTLSAARAVEEEWSIIAANQRRGGRPGGQGAMHAAATGRPVALDNRDQMRPSGGTRGLGPFPRSGVGKKVRGGRGEQLYTFVLSIDLHGAHAARRLTSPSARGYLRIVHQGAEHGPETGSGTHSV